MIYSTFFIFIQTSRNNIKTKTNIKSVSSFFSAHSLGLMPTANNLKLSPLQICQNVWHAYFHVYPHVSIEHNASPGLNWGVFCLTSLETSLMVGWTATL